MASLRVASIAMQRHAKTMGSSPSVARCTFQSATLAWLKPFPNLTSGQCFSSTSISSLDDIPFENVLGENIREMTNEELADTSTIPGWNLIHSPPRKFPRGALVGTVVSDKMQKTVNVAVDRYRIVPKIRKRMKYTRKFMAHDENEVANLGDLVMIVPCHRISKRKHFMLREIIREKGQL